MEAELMSSRPILFLLLLTAVVQTGCVHRRVTVNSYPQGALVKVDGRDIGYTPASFDFTWYGTREVQLLMDGYETRTEHVDINAPWYQKFVNLARVESRRSCTSAPRRINVLSRSSCSRPT